MKKLLPILLLVSACDSRAPEEEGEGSGAAESNLAALPAAPGGEDAAALQAKVTRAMALALPDAAGAEYRALRAGAGGAACGEVATGGKSVFRPFIVTPDGLAVVAAGPAIAWEDPDDFVADAWIRWCATPEELQRLAPQLEKAAANSAASLPEPLPDPELPPPSEPVPEPPPTPATPEPKAKRDAPKPQIDSFFNSVDRPR